ncbi:hypothetical protein LMG3410_06154 [Achromobacter aegrifaciens]|nr:hypothetical protein LMG3410_06154 [Achromobacter aegrifaciens]
MSGNALAAAPIGALLPKQDPNAFGASTQVSRVSSAAPGPSQGLAQPASGWTSPSAASKAWWLPDMPCSSNTTARARSGGGP